MYSFQEAYITLVHIIHSFQYTNTTYIRIYNVDTKLRPLLPKKSMKTNDNDRVRVNTLHHKVQLDKGSIS